MVESDPLGVTEHHMNGYVLSKIIGESVVTMLSTEFVTPAVIVRIAQMYGPRGGAPTARIDRVKRGEPVPVFGTNPNEASIMFEDDYVEKLIASTGIASIPPVVLNFAGTQTTIQEYCTIAAELLGIEATFVTSPEATRPLPVDLTKMRSYLGRTRTPLKNAIARTIEASEAERGTGWGTLWLPGD
jgi:nucleoside-diphosphate-sugar epimerase